MARRRTTNPADLAREEEFLLRAILWTEEPTGRRSFFARLRRVSERAIFAAIRSRSIRPITSSTEWNFALVFARSALELIVNALLRRGYRSGLLDLPSRGDLGVRIATFADERAGQRAIELIQAIDSKNRRTISKLVRAASRRYAASPDIGTLRDLASKIRPQIGLTPWQSGVVTRFREKLEIAEAPRSIIEKKVIAKTRGMIANRAAQIADRATIEAISLARHEAWTDAIEAGELRTSARKQWQDQGDAAVRATHAAQTDMGPIRMGEVYPLHGVQHPPSPDFGCRCWEILIP